MKKKRLQKSDWLWLSAVALLILLQFWWLPGNPGTPDDTYSNTVEGKRGFFQTLEALSHADMLPTVRRETDRLIPNRPSTLIIVSPDRYPNEDEQSDLANFVLQGGTLLFAPNWSTTDCSMPRLHIETTHRYFAEQDILNTSNPPPTTTVATTPATSSSPSSQMTAEAEDGQTPAKNLADEESAVQPTNNPIVVEKADQKGSPESEKAKEKLRRQMAVQAADDSDAMNIASVNARSPLVRGGIIWRTRAAMVDNQMTSDILVESNSGTKQAASWAYGRGLVLLSASPDVFSNSSMLDPVRAELAVRLVEHAHAHHGQPNGVSGSPDIVVSEYLNTSDKYHGAAVLVSPTLRSGTLQLILVAFLAGWYGFHRFGPVKRVALHERRSLTESAESVGNLQFRTASGSESVRSYLDYVTVHLQKTFGPSVRLENTKVIAARAGLDAADVAQAINNATNLASQQDTSAPAAAAAIRQLAELLSRVSGGKMESS